MKKRRWCQISTIFCKNAITLRFFYISKWNLVKLREIGSSTVWQNLMETTLKLTKLFDFCLGGSFFLVHPVYTPCPKKTGTQIKFVLSLLILRRYLRNFTHIISNHFYISMPNFVHFYRGITKLCYSVPMRGRWDAVTCTITKQKWRRHVIDVMQRQ